MLRSLKDLERYNVIATDGDVGYTVDFLFDDQQWVVRYLVVETAGFLGGPRVPISPISFGEADWNTRRFHLLLTSEKVKNSPGIDTDKPVSRQLERDYFGYYAFPYYWGGTGLWGMGGYPTWLLGTSRNEGPVVHDDEAAGDVHLRSAQEVHGYHVQGTDESIGHVADFLIDDESWAVRYLVIDTRNWWFGKRVLVAPHWATRVSWAEGMVYVHKTREEIRNGPEWNGSDAIGREYENLLHDYYGQPAYWEHDSRSEAAHRAHRSPIDRA